jgi:hypothetical protein
MITSKSPGDWRDLQEWVAQILDECGFTVEVAKIIDTAHGNVEIDVYAEEAIKGRTYRILCECKHWKARVPQSVIHGFRTVVADSGSNIGYIVSSAGFQSGAMTAAELTNLKLLTWMEFQSEFEQSWFEQHLLPFVAERLDPLLTYTEPLLPPAFEQLDDAEKRIFLALKDKYDPFGWLMMKYTPYCHLHLFGRETPYENTLPLRRRIPPEYQKYVPDRVLDATGYREFLEAALEYGEQAIREFRKAIKKEAE